MNRIGGVMVCMLALSAVDRGQTKDYKLVFVDSPLSMRHKGERAKTGGLGIRIICLSGATCLSVDCCFSELAL